MEFLKILDKKLQITLNKYLAKRLKINTGDTIQLTYNVDLNAIVIKKVKVVPQ